MRRAALLIGVLTLLPRSLEAGLSPLPPAMNFQVTVNPSFVSFTAEPRQPRTVDVVWTLMLTLPPPQVILGNLIPVVIPVQVTSPSTKYRTLSGQRLGQVPAITRSGSLPMPALAFPMQIPETLMIDERLQNQSQLTLTRTFNVLVTRNPAAACCFQAGVMTLSDNATVTIDLPRGLGGPLNVYRMALRFRSGHQGVRVVRRGEEPNMEIFADVTYSGTGMIRAQWLMADPRSTGGMPVFRPLRLVQRFLGPGQRVSFPTPPLPSDQPGLYLVAFQILDPPIDFEEPTIRYFVTADGPPAPALAKTLHLVGPPHPSELREDLLFAWHAIHGASAYRVELYPLDPERAPPRFDPVDPRYKDSRARGADAFPFEATPEPPPLLPPADERGQPTAFEVVRGTATPLGRLTRARLRPGHSYVWIVQALDANAVVTAESEPRTLHVPVANAPSAPAGP